MKILKTIAIVLVVVLLASAAALGGLYLGWYPVPTPIVASIAKAQGLNDREAGQLTDIVNLYQVLKTAPEAPLLKRAFTMAGRDTPETEWKAFVHDTWPRISEETLLKVKNRLRIEDADYLTVKTILDARITRAASPDDISLTGEDIARFKALDSKYGFSELFRKFASGSGKGTGGW